MSGFFNRATLASLIMPVLVLAACQQPDRDMASDEVMSDSISQQISSFQSELQSELRQIDNELTEVQQRLSAAGDTLADEMDIDLAELQQERQEIDRNLQEMSQETTDAWQDTRNDIRRRVDALAVDVSRARMKAADSVEEFKSIAQEELSEIETNMTRYESESMASNEGMTPGSPDMDAGPDDMAQDEPMPNAEDQRVDPMAPGIGDGRVMTDNNEVTQWQEERQELAQDIESLDASTADDEFMDRKDELADAIADLNAEVRQAVSRAMEGSDFVQADF